jgi:hypothetical protein
MQHPRRSSSRTQCLSALSSTHTVLSEMTSMATWHAVGCRLREHSLSNHLIMLHDLQRIHKSVHAPFCTAWPITIQKYTRIYLCAACIRSLSMCPSISALQVVAACRFTQ